MDSDRDIAGMLSKIVEMQRAIRRNVVNYSVWTGLVFLRVNYLELPSSITRRLTEIDPGAVARIPDVIDNKGTEEQLRAVCDKVAGDAALAQTIRAANIYRDKAGYPPLSSEGYPLSWADTGRTEPPEEQEG